MNVGPQYLSQGSGTAFQKIVNVNAYLGTQQVPVYAFRIELGAYGKIGNASFTTSVAALQANDISIDSINASTVLQNYTPLQIYVNDQLIFGGYYFFGHYSFHDDVAQIHGRDYAAPLFDAKRSLASYNYQNATVTSLIKQIGTQFGIANFDLRPQNNPNVGTIISTQLAGSVDATRPQPLWDYFVLLAKMSGSSIYVDPNNTLHLVSLSLTQPQGLTGATATSPSNSTSLFKAHTYYWQPIPGGAAQPQNNYATPRIYPQSQSNQVPLMKLDILHQPQRNKNFAVVVMTHHQGTTQSASSTVLIMGTAITIPGGGTVKAKKYVGAAGVQVRSLLSSKQLGVPTYYKWIDGKTPSQIQAAAEDLANQISLRLFVYTGVVDGDITLQPLCPIFVYDISTPTDIKPLIGFGNGNQLTCQSVIHSFNMPQGDGFGGDGDGFTTTFKANNLPPADASEDDVSSAIGGSSD